MEEFEKGLKMISEELPKRIADEANPDPVPAETDDLQEPAEEKTAPGQTSPPDPDAPVIIDIVVEFRGGARIKEESVLAKMKTKAGDRLDSQVLDEDFKRLYEISPVENVTLLGEPLGDGIRLIFRIEAAEN